MCMIIVCENCIWKDRVSPCAQSQTNPKCVFYIKPRDRDKPEKDDSKSKDDKKYNKGNLPL